MNELTAQFYQLLTNCLNETNNTFITEITNRTEYKFAVSNSEKIEFIKTLKNDYLLDNINPYNDVMGVNYTNKTVVINKAEVTHLIKLYGVNLVNTNYGLFNNENDQTKSLAWRSHQIVICTIDYCLKLQIINSLIDSLHTTEKGNIIFLNNHNVNSEAFFKYLVNVWLLNEPHKPKALSCIVYNMLHRNTESETSYKIISSVTHFTEYWNETYSEITRLYFENPRNSKLNQFNDTKDNSYQNKFNSHLNKYLEV
jgi:hypothetical protein